MLESRLSRSVPQVPITPLRRPRACLRHVPRLALQPKQRSRPLHLRLLNLRRLLQPASPQLQLPLRRRPLPLLQLLKTARTAPTPTQMAMWFVARTPHQQFRLVQLPSVSMGPTASAKVGQVRVHTTAE